MYIPHPRESQTRYRIVGELYILFWKKDTIYVDNGSLCLVFHRWFAGKNSYSKNWRPFMRFLTENNHLTMSSISECARRNEVEIASSKLPIPRIRMYELPSQFIHSKRSKKNEN